MHHVTWYLGELADYNFMLVHKPETQNKADSLSWWPNYDTGANDNNDITVLPEHLFVNTMEILIIKQKVYEAQESQVNK